MRKSLPLLFCILLAACAAQPPASEGPTRAGQQALELLASFFPGNWESVPADPPRTIRVVEFWKGGNARWFYLEWTRAGEARPLRQQVLRVAEGGEPIKLAVTVHRLPGDPLRFAGEWRKPVPFEGLKPDQMPAIEACRMRGLRSMDALFEIATEGMRCPGDLPGAPHARFELTMTSADVAILEQPIDAAGRIVPGGRVEPYLFRRMSSQPR